jgi:hypothetical protein
MLYNFGKRGHLSAEGSPGASHGFPLSEIQPERILIDLNLVQQSCFFHLEPMRLVPIRIFIAHVSHDIQQSQTPDGHTLQKRAENLGPRLQ